jgi:hypothetical protein
MRDHLALAVPKVRQSVPCDMAMLTRLNAAKQQYV